MTKQEKTARKAAKEIRELYNKWQRRGLEFDEPQEIRVVTKKFKPLKRFKYNDVAPFGVGRVREMLADKTPVYNEHLLESFKRMDD